MIMCLYDLRNNPHSVMCLFSKILEIITYWLLITSTTQYLDLYKYLTPMREKMVENAEDAYGLLENPLSLIHGFSVDGKDVLARLLEVSSQEQLRESLQSLFRVAEQHFQAKEDRRANKRQAGKTLDKVVQGC